MCSIVSYQNQFVARRVALPFVGLFICSRDAVYICGAAVRNGSQHITLGRAQIIYDLVSPTVHGERVCKKMMHPSQSLSTSYVDVS